MILFGALIVFKVIDGVPLGYLVRIRSDTACIKHSMLVAFVVNANIAVTFEREVFANH